MSDTVNTAAAFESSEHIEERLRLLVDQIPALVWSKLPDGSLDFFNQRFREYTGLSLEQGLGWGWINAFHPDDRRMDEWRTALAAGEPFEQEARLRRADGKYRWFAIRATPVKNDQGVIVKWLGTSTDIDDRKRAEAELRQLVDAVPQHIIVLDSQGQRLHTNQPVLDYHGYTLEEFLVVDYCHCFHPDDLEAFKDRLHFGIASKQPWETEVRLHRKDGQYRWFLIRANPLRNEEGQVVRWYLSRTDIEERKQAEREVQQIVDAVPQHIVVYSADGRRLQPNKVTLEYFDWTVDEFLDDNRVKDIFHPDDVFAFYEAKANGIRNGTPFSIEARVKPKRGQYRWFLFLFKPFRNEQGEIVRWYGTGTDIEDRKQAEEALRRSEAYLAEAQRLSHTGSFAHDPATGEITYWSEEAYRTFGFDPAKGLVSFQEARSRVHPDDLQKFDEARERGIQEKAGVNVDFRVVLPDASTKHVHCVSRPLFDGSGHFVEVVGTNMDVTEQWEAQAALEKSFNEIKQLKEQLYRENLALKEEVDQASLFEEIVGSSAPLRRVLLQVTKVAQSDSTVLITGETGTGKELIARAIHKRSPRSSRAFVSVNCAAIPATLIASELFGHEKGAFTGATQRRLGRFELAEGGTLFLDEVGDLPPETQISLLRVLQERQFERVGGNQSVSVDVRIIAATNRDLKAAIAVASFRSDLFYRLNVFPIDVPPLRHRKEDIPLLIEYLTERYASKAGKRIKQVEKRTLKLLQSYEWPGNIRELQNVIERAVILCESDTLSVDEVWFRQERGGEAESANGLARIGADKERALIESALAESRGRVAGASGAAARLGIPRSTLETKIRSLKIDKHRFRSL